MNEKYIAVVKDHFETPMEFWNSVHRIVEDLVSLNYSVQVRWDNAEPSVGVLIIEFDEADMECADRIAEWLTPEEWELIYDFRQDKKNED